MAASDPVREIHALIARAEAAEQRANDEAEKRRMLYSHTELIASERDELRERTNELADALRTIADEPPPQAWADAAAIARAALDRHTQP